MTQRLMKIIYESGDKHFSGRLIRRVRTLFNNSTIWSDCVHDDKKIAYLERLKYCTRVCRQSWMSVFYVRNMHTNRLIRLVLEHFVDNSTVKLNATFVYIFHLISFCECILSKDILWFTLCHCMRTKSHQNHCYFDGTFLWAIRLKFKTKGLWTCSLFAI